MSGTGWALYVFITVITLGIACMYSLPAYAGAGLCTIASRARDFRRWCLIALFLILFLLSAFRLNVGNDYGTYVEFMHRLYTSKYIPDPGVPTEWGFNLLARFIYFLSGYENFILVFAVYAAVTIGLFLKAMDELSPDFTISFFMFMTLGYYFQSFSTIRYYLALAVALYSLKYVFSRRWVSFAALILLGSGFHKSILILLVLYPVANVAWKKWQLAIIALLSTTGLFLQDFYLKVFLKLYPDYEGTEYLEGSGISWINIVKCVIVLGLSIYIYYKNPKCFDERHRFCLYLNAGAILLYAFWGFMPLVNRIGYYLTVSHLIYVPMLIRDMDDERAEAAGSLMRKLIGCALIVGCVGYFVMYLTNAYNDGVLVLPYRTFFFHDMVDTLSDVM